MTLSGVYVTTVVAEKQSLLRMSCVCVCVCVRARVEGGLRCPASNSRAPYETDMWPGWLCGIFPHCPTKGTVFENTLLNIKCIFNFSTTFELLSDHF